MVGGKAGWQWVGGVDKWEWGLKLITFPRNLVEDEFLQ
jgi:hypothetical protein